MVFLMFKSIKDKMLVSYLLLTFLVNLLLVSFAYLIVYRSLLKTHKIYLQDLGRLEAEKIDDFIQSRIDFVTKLAKGKEVEDYHVNYRATALTEYFIKYKNEFSKVSYIDKHGQERVKMINGHESDALLDLSQNKYFQYALQNPNKVVFTDIEDDPELGTPAMHFFMARHNYFGDEFIGVIAISLSSIGEDIISDRVGKSGFVMLIDKNGRILYCPYKDKLLTQMNLVVKGNKHLKLIPDPEKPEGDFFRGSLFGRDSLISYHPVKETEWFLLTVLPYQEFMIIPNRLMQVSGLLFAMIIVMVFIVSIQMVKDISDPILKLVSAVNSIAKGNLSRKVEIATEDEIGLLGRSFNKMVDDLKETTVSRDELARENAERKKAEDALKDINRKMYAILNQSFQFIGLMTLEGTLLEANRAALELSGIDQASVLGKPFWETPWWTHSPELQEKLRDSIRKAALGEFIRFEATHVAKDGSLRYVDFSLKPVTDETGKVIYLIPEGRDITERKKIEEENLKHTWELEIFYKASIRREERIIELKKEVDVLKKELGK